MDIEVRTTTENIDWNSVTDILNSYGLSHYDAGMQKKIFENSYAVVFLYDKEKLIGCGRVLSDGICQAAVYNIALAEAYHGKQIGRLLIESLLRQVKGCTVTLYTHPKTVGMYEKFGFRRLKTGMVIFEAGEEELEWMEDTGFVLPKKYRFGDNEYERET
jgi:ribosomal protein S18 acetylase RimI-like enzyme